MSKFLVIAEHREGELREVSLEVLAMALRVGATVGADVETAVLASDPGAIAEPLIGRTPSLRLLSHPELAHYNPELYLSVLTDLIASLEPSVVLMAHTSQGMDLAPALAGRLGLTLVSDCVDLSMAEGGGTQVTRQCYGGKLRESFELKPYETVVLTVQVGAFSQAAVGACETTRHQVALSGIEPRHGRRFLEHFREALEDVDIAAADILVSVGRGIGSQENIALAQELADVLGATLSCSRPVADAGWLPQSRQVGTSGKTVRPKLYIALGISGAFQHLAGMRGSETILAVNKDPRAPIFQVASYGIVDDVLEVLPLLKRHLASREA